MAEVNLSDVENFVRGKDHALLVMWQEQCPACQRVRAQIGDGWGKNTPTILWAEEKQLTGDLQANHYPDIRIMVNGRWLSYYDDENLDFNPNLPQILEAEVRGTPYTLWMPKIVNRPTRKQQQQPTRAAAMPTK